MMRSLCVTAAALVALGGCGNDAAKPAEATRLAQLQTRLGALQANIERARDVSAINNLQRAYGYYLDKGLADDLADLFTDNEPAAGPLSARASRRTP